MDQIVNSRQEDRPRITADGFGLLILRLFVGSFTLLAGIQIIVSDADFTEIVRGLGVPFPSAAALLVVAGHVVLGVLLILGLLTRPVGVLLAVKFYLIFYTYYITQFGAATLRLLPVGTLWGVESLAYGTAGVLFACTGPGRISLDAVLRPLWTRATGRAAQRRVDAAVAGRVLFRLFIGFLLLLHGAYQIGGVSLIPGTETMTRLSSKLATLGLPLPTLMAWIVTLAMLLVGLLLIVGRLVRVGGLLLAPAALVLLLAVPGLGGTTVEGYGFHGEQLFFLTIVSVYFACTTNRPRKPMASAKNCGGRSHTTDAATTPSPFPLPRPFLGR